MANTLRDAMHMMKLQLKPYLTDNLGDSNWQAQAADAAGARAVQSPAPAPTQATYYVYLLGGNGSIGDLGIDDRVSKTASCRSADGGQCGPTDPPVTVFKKHWARLVLKRPRTARSNRRSSVRAAIGVRKRHGR